MPPQRLEPPRSRFFGGGGGPSVEVGGGGGGDGVLGAVGEALGNVVTDVITGTVSGVASAAIGKALLGLGLPPDVTALLTNALFNNSQLASLAGAGPSIGWPLTIIRQAAQPFDVSGIGGGVLTASPYLGQAGAIAGDLLRLRKISVSSLLSSKQKSVIASLYEGRNPLALVG